MNINNLIIHTHNSIKDILDSFPIILFWISIIESWICYDSIAVVCYAQKFIAIGWLEYEWQNKMFSEFRVEKGKMKIF